MTTLTVDSNGGIAKIVRVLALCAALVSLSAGAAPTLTYYSGDEEMTKSSWTADASDAAAGWAYDLKALDTDTLTLSGPGPYKLCGSAIDFSVIVAESCTVTLEGYSVSDSQSPIVVSAGATLTLLVGEGTNTLAGATTATHGNHPGIEVQTDGTVVIDKVEGKDDADCVLNASGGNDCAAIGAKDNSSCGDIVINGGTVNATGGDEAAGIGGGNVKNQAVEIGTITINGGIVTATGNDRGAGIGTGLVQRGGTATAKGVYINGGVVTATATDGRAAGIGSGEVTGLGDSSLLGSAGSVTVNEIVISGGTVTASTSNDKENSNRPQEAAGAGIGTGIAEAGGEVTIAKISISGGTVTASGACRGAGIGMGEAYDGLGQSAKGTVGSIEISGGQVTAIGGSEAAGIGTGVACGSHVETTVSEITISGGTVTATKGANANGSDIGVATSGNSTGTTTMDSVTVTGGSIAAGTTMTNPSSGDGRDVYTLSVAGDWQPGEKVAVAGLDGYGVNDLYADEKGCVVMLVPDGTYVFNANGRLYEATVNGGDAAAQYAAATGMEIDGVDIACGSGNGWFYEGETLSVETNATLAFSGQSRLPVELLLDDGVDVTLDGVTINGASGVPAVTTTADASVTIRLNGESALSGGDGAAAVQPGEGATITILDGLDDGIGLLTASGGAGAAGIGAGASTACGNVTIAGGHVAATGGAGASGIGAGAGAGANCGLVAVSGGTVEAASGGPTASDVGNGDEGVCSGVEVTGGSLVTANGTVDPPASGLGDVGGRAVAIQNDNWAVGEAIHISGLPAGYGTNDICATETKSICVWLPDGGYSLEVNGEWYIVSVDGDGCSVDSVDPHGGATWLAAGSQLGLHSIRQDGEHMALSVSVPLRKGADIADWARLSVANGKVAVVVAESLEAMAAASLETFLGGGTAEGASLVYVGTEPCSPTAAEHVSSDAAANSIVVRVPKPSQTTGFYRVYVL